MERPKEWTIELKDGLKKLSRIVYGGCDDLFDEMGKEGFNKWLSGICDDLDALYQDIDDGNDISWFDVYLLGDVINILRAIRKV